MQAACTVLFSGAFAFQTFCGILLAELPQTDPVEVQFLQRITEYWKNGHVEDAKEQLRKFISDYPSSPYLNEIRKMLGDVYLQEGSLEQALAYFEKITLPPQVEAKEALFLRRIAEYWKEGHLEDAKKQLTSYLSNYPSSVYLNETLAMLGDLYLHEGALKEALTCYEKISSSRCEQLTGAHRAEAMYHLGQYDELIQWASTHPQCVGTNERIHLLLADIHYRKALQEMNPDVVQQHATASLGHFSHIKHLDKSWKFIVAYLTALKGEKVAAAELYITLAGEWTEKKDDCLYHAASLLNNKDPAKAISLLQEVNAKSTKFQKEAAFNELCLLYREKRYQDFIEREKLLGQHVDKGFSLHLTFYKASSYFHLNKFDEAAAYFKDYLQSSPTSKEEIRYALQNLFFCGYKIGQSDLLDFALTRWKDDLALDEGYLEGLLASAEIHLKEKNYQEAANRFSEILDCFPSHLIHEIALFNYSQTLLALERFSEGRDAIESYLSHYGDSSRSQSVWQNLVYASMELFKKAEKAERDAQRAYLIGVLQKAIKANESFNDDTLRIYRLHLAQLLFEMGQLQEALAIAEQYLKLYPEHASTREMRLIQISCCLTLGSPLESLVESLEAALKVEQDSDLQSRLHLQLFNAYLTLETPNAAVDHLLAVYTKGNAQIKTENLLWLAEQMQKRQNLSIAKEILEKTLCIETSKPLYNPTLSPLSIEEGALQLKELYLALGNQEKACTVLELLSNLQKSDPSISWRFPRKVSFELADLHEKIGEDMEALCIYNELIGDAAFSQASFYLRAAILNRAKLQLKTLSTEERKEGAEALATILDTLKDLQISRNVESEPVHLEAALEYASIRCSLLPAAEQARRMIFYLERIEEDFDSGSSDLATNYIHQRAKWPEQAALIGNYLRYISAEIQRLESLEAEKAGDLELSLSLKNESKSALLALSQELTETTPVLRERVIHSLMQLEIPDQLETPRDPEKTAQLETKE